MATAQGIYDLNVQERSAEIVKAANLSGSETELEKAQKLAAVINLFIDEYFNISIARDRARPTGSVLGEANLISAMSMEIERFKPIALSKLRSVLPTAQELKSDPKNPYELSGAVKLAFANRATRTLSTTMGLLWERIANISPYAINPEAEFGLKIKGIDLIAKNIETNLIEYQQVKTQRNTLTGSQKNRSVEELSIHANAIFCACFSLSSWTFGDPHIPRVSGEEFWRRIGISYHLFESQVERLVLDLETAYVSLLG